MLGGMPNFVQGALLNQNAEKDITSMVNGSTASLVSMKETGLCQIASTEPFIAEKYKTLCDGLNGQASAGTFCDQRNQLQLATLFVFGLRNSVSSSQLSSSQFQSATLFLLFGTLRDLY